MRLVIIESPYGTRPDGTRATTEEVARNVRYARAAMLDCLQRGEAPYASHLLYTQCLDDATEDERDKGMQAGWAWLRRADLVAVYLDLGVTKGMRGGFHLAHALRISVEERRLPDWPS